VVRHGQTSWSLAGRHTGHTDVPLDPDGEAQARSLAPALARLAITRVLVSPLTRARETGRLAGMAATAEVTPDLLEWDYGEYEGRTSAEIARDRPGWNLFGDGVPGGETAADVGRRVDRVIAQARSAGGSTLCVAHGHVLRVLAARWVGLPPAGGRLLALDAASLGHLGWEHQVPVISRWNQPAPG
jgi:probable phosphoglycerate mutase